MHPRTLLLHREKDMVAAEGWEQAAAALEEESVGGRGGGSLDPTGLPGGGLSPPPRTIPPLTTQMPLRHCSYSRGAVCP